MAFDAHPYLVSSLVTNAPGAAGTSIVVSAGDGSMFAAVPFNAVVWPADAAASRANSEVVRVTARSTDTLTVTRAREGTSARSIVAGDRIAIVATPKTFTDIEDAVAVAVAVSARGNQSLTVMGHSYTQAYGTANPFEMGMVEKLQALLGIHQENVNHYGQSGAYITGLGNFFWNQPFGGWAGALQFLLPDNCALIAGEVGNVNYNPPLVGVPSTLVIVHGVNDFLRDAIFSDALTLQTQAALIARNAGKHAYRTVLSRHRAGIVLGASVPISTVAWDSTIAFGGSWSDVTDVIRNTGPAYKQTAANGATVTVTLPVDFPGGVVTLCFVAQQGGMTRLTANVAASGAVTVNVAANSSFPASGTVVIRIGSEEMVVTGGLGSNAWTVTAGNRGANGTTAAAHSTGDPVYIAQDTHKVAWSGTLFSAGSNPSHPDTPLGGQGCGGQPVSVVVRYPCLASDAGKTIIATVGNMLAADTSATVNFDSWWVESTEPAPSVLTNVMQFRYPSQLAPPTAWSDADGFIAAWNSDIAAVVAEFTDGFTAIADMYSIWRARNGTITGAMNATDTTTAIGWTAYDAQFTPLVGQSMSFGGEHCLVTAVSGTAPNWTLTLLRGYAGTTKTTHASGDFLGNNDWMFTDDLHPNVKGHAVFARALYDALNSISGFSAYQLANSQGLYGQDSQDSAALGIEDNFYLYPACYGPLTTGSPGTGVQVALPIYINRDCILVGIGVMVSSALGGNLRFGIWLPSQSGQRPGALLKDFGTVAVPVALDNVGIGSGMTGGGPLFLRLRKGWYWLGCVQSIAASTLRTIPLGQSQMPLMTGSPLPAALPNSPVGWQVTGVAGALGDWSFLTTQPTTAIIPRIFVRLRSVNH